MTTVATRGNGILAADQQCTWGDSVKLRVSKLHRLKDGSVAGGCGHVSEILAAIRWLETRKGKAPKMRNCDVLIARPDGTTVTEMNSALNAESLAKGSVGSEGVQALMQAGAQRLELIARVIAETGIRRDYLLMLKLVTQYQDRVQQVKINGRWLQIDPREWKNQYDVTVSVGLGNASKQQQVANLSLILQAQKEAAQVGLATPQNIYNALSRLTESMGYKDSDQFWTAPQPGQQPNQGPPPEVMVEQLKQQGQMQQIQAKAQADIQVERMRQEYQAAQAQQEQALQAEKDRLDAQNKMALEQYKVDKQAELELAKAQIQRQTALDTAQISAQASMVNAANKPEPNGQD